jgi:hypothetical protein
MTKLVRYPGLPRDEGSGGKPGTCDAAGGGRAALKRGDHRAVLGTLAGHSMALPTPTGYASPSIGTAMPSPLTSRPCWNSSSSMSVALS